MMRGGNKSTKAPKRSGKSRAKDLRGRRFGRLVALKDSGQRTGNGCARWVCRCDCGHETLVSSDKLLGARTRSCGCWQRERARETATRHGASKHPLYKTWSAMLARCHDENDPSFPRYGAKGIAVCGEWRADPWKFFHDMGPRPPAHTLDRIDNSKGYSPENTRWADLITQNRNTRRSGRHDFPDFEGRPAPKPFHLEDLAVNAAGRDFGLWRPLFYVGKHRDGSKANHFWWCECLGCGTQRAVRHGALIYGFSRSCGCAGRHRHGKQRDADR